MQNIDPISGPPRRSLDLEDYFDMLRRHATWILGPAFAGLVIAFVVAFLWPDTYVSVATIRIVPPQVPASLVPTNVAQGMADRINSMYQTITNKQNLGNIVNTYNLYPRERQRKPMEDIVEQMRRGVNIGAITPMGGDGRQMAAFQISFTYENRLLAQKVVQDFVGRFMSENTKQRTNQSILTTQFLKDQFDSAKRDLETLESKLVAYRANYQGRLPEQLAQNTMQVSMLEQRAGNINNALARVAQNRMLLESDLRTLKNQKAAIAPTPENQVQRQRNAAIDAQDREIYALENRLTLLRQQYKDTWPDVQATIAQLNTAKALREKLIARDQEEQPSDAAVKAAGTRRTDPNFEREQRAVDGSILRLETQLKALTIEEQDYQKDLSNTERAIKEVQSRISAAPASEQQYGDLIRDHALAKQKYEDMDHRRSSSEVSEELERRQQGETLELLDPASLPSTPTQPKRQMIIGAGFGIGLAIGVALAGAREARDQTLKNLKDVRAYTQLILLGSIPLLENDVVVRRRRRLAWLAWSTACLVGIMIMTGSVFYYYTTKV